MGKFKDLTGQKFGRLTVISATDFRDADKNRYWLCQCECGNKKQTSSKNLTLKRVRSCGCLSKEKAKENVKKARKEATIRANKLRKIEYGTCIDQLYMKNKRSTTGITGVSYYKNRNRYRAHIFFKGKRIYLGDFKNFDDAVKARKEAEKKYFQPVIEKVKVQGAIS